MRPIRACCDELAIIAAGDDALAIRDARQNATRMDRDATFGFIREKQRFLAEHKYWRLAQEMHTDHGRARIDGAHAVGERRNWGLRVAHVRRCSFRSLGGFYLPASYGR